MVDPAQNRVDANSEGSNPGSPAVPNQAQNTDGGLSSAQFPRREGGVEPMTVSRFQEIWIEAAKLLADSTTATETGKTRRAIDLIPAAEKAQLIELYIRNYLELKVMVSQCPDAVSREGAKEIVLQYLGTSSRGYPGSSVGEADFRRSRGAADIVEELEPFQDTIARSFVLGVTQTIIDHERGTSHWWRILPKPENLLREPIYLSDLEPAFVAGVVRRQERVKDWLITEHGDHLVPIDNFISYFASERASFNTLIHKDILPDLIRVREALAMGIMDSLTSSKYFPTDLANLAHSIRMLWAGVDRSDLKQILSEHRHITKLLREVPWNVELYEERSHESPIPEYEWEAEHQEAIRQQRARFASIPSQELSSLDLVHRVAGALQTFTTSCRVNILDESIVRRIGMWLASPQVGENDLRFLLKTALEDPELLKQYPLIMGDHLLALPEDRFYDVNRDIPPAWNDPSADGLLLRMQRFGWGDAQRVEILTCIN